MKIECQIEFVIISVFLLPLRVWGGKLPRHHVGFGTPGKDAFHRVPLFVGEIGDAVERVLTSQNGELDAALPVWRLFALSLFFSGKSDRLARRL